MSFETEFVRPMEREIQKKVKDVSVTLVADTAEEVYRNVLNLWPIDTAWSQANHRMNVGRNPARDFPLEPPTRPKGKGALLGEASANENEQLTKLGTLSFGDSVLIGNAVPYAADVGGSPDRPNKGNGVRIYAEAAAIGSAIIASRIG